MGDTGMNDSGTAPGWYSDPRARFELRYHNGRAWTADVSTGGERFVDPRGTRPAPPMSAQSTPGVPQNTPEVPGQKNAIATASMVLGIVAICIGWMPFVVILGIIAAVLAIVFGVKGRTRAIAASAAGADAGEGAGFAVAGIVTGAVALLVCIGGVVFSVSLIRAVDRFENPAEHDAAITSCVLGGDELTATGTLTNTSDQSASFTVRIFFVRPGTDNARHQANVTLDDVGPGETGSFEVSRQVGGTDLDCIIGAVRGPLPYGVDPGT
jgi:hypothetical protein